MKNWFLEQGMPLYTQIIVFLAGLFALWMTSRSYKRLIREADSMGTSEHRLMKYIKIKVTSYFKIGMHPNDTQALIGRYIKKHRIGLFSLYSWSRLPYLCMTILLGIGGSSFVYNQTRTMGNDSSGALLGISVLASGILFGMFQYMDFKGKEVILTQTVADYVSNYLNNKLAYEYKDQAGKVAPEQYKRALQEIAAASAPRRKERKQKYYYDEYAGDSLASRNDEVDARIVEDVLKEFLC